MNRATSPADRIASRRAFIAARWPSVGRERRPIAAIGASCVSRRGVACRVCAEYCDRGAIRFRAARGGISVPIVDGAVCTGCRACLMPCPVGAIALGMESESCA
jgi:Fe-S-cluster-containing hydrogenase component 2